MSIVVEKLDNKTTVLNVEKDNVTYVLLADKPGEKQVTVNLAKAGVEAKILGLFIAREGEMVVRTIQHHMEPHTTSDLLFKSVLLGAARFDYHGLIQIDQPAQDSNAYQRNDNLTLHDQAEVETQPELEILANEVRCTHGATVGQIDEEQIYYLMTRGMGRKTAEQIILEGFLGEVADRVDDDELSDKIFNFIKESLGGPKV